MKRSALFLLFVWLAAPLAQCADIGADELLKAAKTAATARRSEILELVHEPMKAASIGVPIKD